MLTIMSRRCHFEVASCPLQWFKLVGLTKCFLVVGGVSYIWSFEILLKKMRCRRAMIYVESVCFMLEVI